MTALPALAVIAGLVALYVRSVRRLRRHGYRFRRPPSDQPLYRFHPDRSATFRSTARLGWFDTGWTTVTIDRGWLSIGFFFPKWVERYRVTAIRSFPGFLTTGFMFDTTDGRYEGIILWSFQPDRLRATFTLYDWPVPAPAAVP